MIFFDMPADMAWIKVTINDERLTSVIGESYKWGEGFAEILKAMIQSKESIRYRNAKALRKALWRNRG